MIAPISDSLRARVDWWFAGDIIGPIRRFAGAMVVVAGPWLVSIAALALISLFMEPVMGRTAVEDLRLTVIYAFCVAPLTAGPLGAIAGRTLTEAAASHSGATPFGTYLAASALSTCIAIIAGSVVALALGISPELATAFVFLCGAASQLWISFSILTAIRRQGTLIAAFLAGMTGSLAAVLAMAQGTPSTPVLIWTFSAGILLCCCISGLRIRRDNGRADADLVQETRTLLAEIRQSRVMAIGVFLAICGIWVDKWIFWLGPDAVRSTAGFLHYPPYDSVMFIAHLTAVPAYTAFFLFHDGLLTCNMKAYRSRLVDGSTYRALKQAKADFVGRIWGGVFTIVFFQAAFTASAVLIAPMLTAAFDLDFDQILILRTGLMAIFFHGVLSMNCAVMLLANRISLFCLMQAGLLLLNGGLTAAIYGFMGAGALGFFIAAGVTAVVSFVLAYRASTTLDFLIMVGENDALYRLPRRAV